MEVGQKVKIVDSFEGLDYNELDIVPEMKQFLGREAIIKEVVIDACFLDIDYECWRWHKDLLKTV
jgi:hypothetical protein